MITINVRGARTLADAQPLMYAGVKVYVTVSGDVAELHLGGHIVAERPAIEVETVKAAQDWAYETIATADAIQAGMVADEGAVNEACDIEAVFAGAVEMIRNQAAGILAEADRRKGLAEHLRAEAMILAAWTVQDESAYNRYVSDGIGATKGRYALMNRASWKHHMAI